MPLEMRLNFGIGLHVGEAILGLVGTEKRMEYTAIGDSINTAKRIQEHASENQVLISKSFYERIASQVTVIPLGSFEPKGKTEKIKIFELTDILV
jgi:class 3 adenylate cyclase